MANLLNNLCGGFLQVFHVKCFAQRLPPRLGIVIQTDVHRRRSDFGPERKYEPEQQRRSPQHHVRSGPVRDDRSLSRTRMTDGRIERVEEEDD